MAWRPANNTELCASNPSLDVCRPAALAFLAFLIQYVGHSFDQYFSNGEKKLNKKNNFNEEYDFIIIGAGSAGCVIANRLSEIKYWKILLLESGGEEPVITDIPSAAMAFTRGSSIDYAYKTQPERLACADNEKHTCTWPRGKLMGGSSSINSMWYVRGIRQDYDDWARFGNPGWSYNDVLAYFKKAEDARNPELLAKYTGNYGTGGPLTIDVPRYKDKNYGIIMDAFKELGLKEIDYNAGSSVIGTSKLQFSQIHGARQSANGAYIRPIRGRRKNLTIKTKSQVIKIGIDKKTKKATHVVFVDLRNNATRRVFARKEIIVSAGVVESPKLLLLSGIGPADELREANIEVVHKLPGVGKNLQDHVNVRSIQVNFDNETSVFSDLENTKKDIIYWMSTHEGPLSGYGILNSVTYYQTPYENTPGVPDIQIVALGNMVNQSTNQIIPYIPYSYYNQITLVVTLLNPRSRGEIKLNKTDPIWSPPLIHPNYFNNSRDVDATIAGIKILRKILSTKIFKSKGLKEILFDKCKHFKPTRRKYNLCLLKYNSKTSHNPSGTCKMGPKNNPKSVVDSELRVHGIKGLRVIDGSIMPVLTRGNTYAPTVMIAEKGSDMIKKTWIKKVPDSWINYFF